MLKNKLTVFLGADSIAIVYQSKGFKKKIINQQYYALDKSLDSKTIENILLHLDETMERMDIKPRSKLHVIFSSDLVRYIVIPAQDVAMSKSEKNVYTTTMFQELYGEIADDWEFKLHDAPWYQETLAVAVEKRLLDALNQIVVKYDLKLKSAQPYLMAAFNSLTKQIGRTSGYLAIVERKRLLLVEIKNGNWKNLRPHLTKTDWQFELSQLLKRESLLNDVADREVLIYAPLYKNIDLTQLNGWQAKLIGPERTSIKDHSFAMLQVIV